MSEWTLDQLQDWDARIQDQAAEFGLDCYTQEFEICDSEAMLGYMAYHGMPSHYPHWSFGKAFEQTKTKYDYGVTGLPYEMVINSDPCLAYLMRDNSLCLQVLTIAHVYGHNDFFKNNFTFTSATDAKETIAQFKARADRVRSYIDDPSIGAEAVEEVLDAAHALSFNRTRNLALKGAKTAGDLAGGEASDNILLAIRDHNPKLEDWQKDLLTIVDEEACYFIPQIETKIMNEGWASYWHHRIMMALPLSDDLRLEFMVRHNQVICPHPGGLNPYHVGFVVWQDIMQRYGEDGRCAQLFAVRESDRDTAFLRRFLTPELMRELDLFSYKARGDRLVVDAIADDEHADTVKQNLLRQIGCAGMPVIRVMDLDAEGRRILVLEHAHDGRDLELSQAEKTMAHIRKLWGHPVHLQTQLRGNASLLQLDDDGFAAGMLN